MRVYRWAILTSLAGLTVILLGTAVFAFQTADVAQSITSNQLVKQTSWQREIPLAVDLVIRESGITAVTARQLQEANFRVPTLSADTLNLTRQGEPVPFHVVGEGDDAVLYFYAQAVTDTLQAPAVYRLLREPGAAMTTRNAPPTGPGSTSVLLTKQWEENSVFLANAQTGDAWLGALLMAPDKWDLALDDIQPDGGPAWLTLRLWSSTDDPVEMDHHVQLHLNDINIMDIYWDGVTEQIVTIPLETDVLQTDAENRLTIYVPGDTGAAGEAIYVDWVQLTYESRTSDATGPAGFSSDAAAITIEKAPEDLLLFDITDPAQPTVLSGVRFDGDTASFSGSGGGKYAALSPDQAHQVDARLTYSWPEPLRTAGRGADYIAIVADQAGFMEALQPLLAYREKQGLRTTAVSLGQIYDEFGHGQPTPQAIRDFLDYARANWEPPVPQFLLLVGDATYDMQNNLSAKNQNLLPTGVVFTANNGYTTSDSWFTNADTNGKIALAIGRFPVQTTEELQTMVQKTIAYEAEAANAPDAAWFSRALLVADDEPYFDLAQERLEFSLSASGYDIHDLHMSEKEDIHYNIISAINRGVGIVNYTGFGSETGWSDRSVFRAEDAGMLANKNRLPIFTAFTCQSGSFTNPNRDSMAEQLLWVEDGGIVASVGTTTRTNTQRGLTLAGIFYRYLLDGRTQTLGEALALTKTAVLGDPLLETAVYNYNLLGDPALRLHRPPGELVEPLPLSGSATTLIKDE
jgi:hypothetical protein